MSQLKTQERNHRSGTLDNMGQRQQRLNSETQNLTHTPQLFPACGSTFHHFKLHFHRNYFTMTMVWSVCRMQTFFFKKARAKQQVKRWSHCSTFVQMETVTAFPTQKWQFRSNASPEELKAGLKQVHAGQYSTQCYSKQPRDCMLSHRWASKHYSKHK